MNLQVPYKPKEIHVTQHFNIWELLIKQNQYVPFLKASKPRNFMAVVL